MAALSSTLAWRIPGTAEPGATVHGVAQSQTRLKDGAREHSDKSEVWISSKMQWGSSPSLLKLFH